jgi:uncharacterized membrane protein YeaQ/YmgE (transglycosylase-associated protein family)
MDALLDLLVTAAVVGVLGFVASLLVRLRQGFFGSIGAGFLGLGVGTWLAGVLKIAKDPVSLTVGGASVPVLYAFVGALIVLLLARLVLRARRR